MGAEAVELIGREFSTLTVWLSPTYLSARTVEQNGNPRVQRTYSRYPPPILGDEDCVASVWPHWSGSIGIGEFHLTKGHLLTPPPPVMSHKRTEGMHSIPR